MALYSKVIAVRQMTLIGIVILRSVQSSVKDIHRENLVCNLYNKQTSIAREASASRHYRSQLRTPKNLLAIWYGGL